MNLNDPASLETGAATEAEKTVNPFAEESMFDGITADDLESPEKLVFTKGEDINGTILDTNEVTKHKAVILTLKLNNTEFVGKQFELWMGAPKKNKEGVISSFAKRSWTNFLLAFFTKEEILGGKADWSTVIGKSILFTAGEPKDYGEKIFQNFNGFNLVKTEKINPEDIPF